MRSVLEYASVVDKFDALLRTNMPYGGDEIAEALDAQMSRESVASFVAQRLTGDAALRNLVAHHYLPQIEIRHIDGVAEFVCIDIEQDTAHARSLSTRARGTFDGVCESLRARDYLT